MWITYIRWALTAILIVGFCFSWWRRLRAEQKQETIYELMSWVILAAAAAGVLGYKLIYRQWGWWEGSGVLAGLAAVAIACRKTEGDFWEWLDMLAFIVMAWAGALTLVWGQYLKAELMAAGLIFLWIVKRTYRNWRWYKSGRPGAIGMVGLVWWGITQVAVAFLQPNKLYWGELTADQWVGSWILAAACVGLLQRSGIKIWHKTKLKKTAQ